MLKRAGAQVVEHLSHNYKAPNSNPSNTKKKKKKKMKQKKKKKEIPFKTLSPVTSNQGLPPSFHHLPITPSNYRPTSGFTS
jgi:hypothetical protein